MLLVPVSRSRERLLQHSLRTGHARTSFWTEPSFAALFPLRVSTHTQLPGIPGVFGPVPSVVWLQHYSQVLFLEPLPFRAEVQLRAPTLCMSPSNRWDT